MRAGRLSCGDVITKSTTLTADVGPCDGNGIIVGADNIRLNLNGHTISGTPGVGNGNAAGIRLPFRTGVTITGHPGNSGKKGTVTGFDGGVFVNGGSGNTIENLVVRDNIGPGGDALLGDGIVLFHSGSNRIINNLVAHSGPFDGIGVLGVDSNNNLIQGNTVEETPLGAAAGGLGNGTGIIINNFLDEEGTPRRGEPIRNNDVINNIVRRNANSGISNLTNIGARIIGNTVQDNGQAGEACFLFPAPTPCPSLRPAAMPSNGIGFQVGPLAPRVTRALIEGNTVTGNTGNGIEINTEENRIIGNTAVGNGGSGAGVVFSGRGGGHQPRFDLYDNTSTETLCEGRDCPPSQRSCDQNVWYQNVFETAFPECAEGTGPDPAPLPPADPSCSDGIDNDGDGFTDEADFNCGGPPPPPFDPGELVPFEHCSDGIDNDGDGFTDEADSNCGGLPPPPLEDFDPGELVPFEPEGPTPIEEGPTPIEEGPTPIEEGPTPIEEGPTPIEEGPTPIEEGPTPIQP
jgi:parallel beta-helix repeat protein